MAANGEIDTVLDSGQQHLGATYAKALLGAAEKTGQTEAVLAEFDSLIEDVLDRLPDLESILTSPRIDVSEKERILDVAFRDRMSVLLRNFLKVVVRRGRANCLRVIRQAAHRLDNELRGRVSARLRTAEPVDRRLLAAIGDRLRTALGKDVVLRTEVDPALIGGMVVRVGDTVYDASVANHLEQLRRETVDRTAREIRGSLDRFAGPE